MGNYQKKQIEATQKYLNGKHKAGLKEDGILGKNTCGALRNFVNLKIPDDMLQAVDMYLVDCDLILQPTLEGSGLVGVEIPIKPIRLKHYRDGKEKTWYLAANVVDSFQRAVAAWEADGGKFRVTETMRSIKVQKSLKKRKPGLAAKPGWSLHGHGLAVDFSIRDVMNGKGKAELLRFYKHLEKYGWFTIYGKPGKVELCPRGREAWHVQKLAGAMHKNVYLRAWAKSRVANNSAEIDKKLLSIEWKKV